MKLTFEELQRRMSEEVDTSQQESRAFIAKQAALRVELQAERGCPDMGTLIDYAEGTLKGWRKFQLALHLLRCPFCKADFHTLATTWLVSPLDPGTAPQMQASASKLRPVNGNVSLTGEFRSEPVAVRIPRQKSFPQLWAASAIAVVLMFSISGNLLYKTAEQKGKRIGWQAGYRKGEETGRDKAITVVLNEVKGLSLPAGSSQIPMEKWSAKGWLDWLLAPDPHNLTEIDKRIAFLEIYLKPKTDSEVGLHLKLIELYIQRLNQTQDKRSRDDLEKRVFAERKLIEPMLALIMGDNRHEGQNQ